MASTKYVTWIGITCLGLAFVWYTLRLIFDEADVERGTYGFYLLITPIVRELPTYKISSGEKARYSNHIGGSAPAYDGLYYCAAAEASDVVDFFDGYFKKRGYSVERFEWGHAYTDKKRQVQLAIKRDEFCKSQVQLEHFEIR